MMPLVLVILNYAGSDLDEASRKINEGQFLFYRSFTLISIVRFME
ncbi:hypothetical protein O3G_MSEX000604 [Manduca sexta]|nr:hypothetical protein O3G_MSEX000604 [Manduca sexta]